MPYQEIREEEKIDLIAILDKMMNIIKKYIKPLSLFVVVGALVGLLVCMFTYKPMYSSEALFIVTLEDGKSIYSVSQSSEELNSRFSSMIKSEYMNEIQTKVGINWKDEKTKQRVIDDVKFNILTLFMIDYYSDYYQSEFFDRMLKIYLAGHLPCGWSGEYPEGKFFVYFLRNSCSFT